VKEKFRDKIVFSFARIHKRPNMQVHGHIHLAIADNHVLLRKSLVDFISLHFRDCFNILIDANDGGALVNQPDKTEKVPDICILALNINGINGLDTITIVKKKWPSIKILLLTVFKRDYSFLKIVSNSINGIISKECTPVELKDALTKIYKSGSYFPPDWPFDITVLRNKEISLPKITDREKKFLSLCCSELTYSEIAHQMGVGERTVDGYRNNLFQKLGVKSRTGLVMFVVKSGIVTF
jgi:two-component system, NarL family, invasion response regulator UvrY